MGPLAVKKQNNMLRDIDQFFASQQEPVKGCLAFLRDFILKYDHRVTEGWRYSMPFYFVDGKRFAYLWINKKTGSPYIGFVDGNKIDHPLLIQEKRTRMKILPVDPSVDIPVKKIKNVLTQVLSLYEK
jgi:hypothetical protein